MLSLQRTLQSDLSNPLQNLSSRSMPVVGAEVGALSASRVLASPVRLNGRSSSVASLSRIGPEGAVNGSLSLRDPLNPTRPGRRRDDYLLLGAAVGQQIRVNMTAPGFDDYLQLVNANTGALLASNDDANGTRNAELTFTVAPGVRYLIRATSFSPNATGAYSLRTSTGRALGTNQILGGVLSTSDPRNPARPNTFRDDYLLTGVSPGQQIRVNMTAPGFDDYLQLINATTGAVVAANDDANGSLNAELAFTAQVGASYIVRATSFAPNATGSYTLSSNTGTLFNANQVVNGALSTGDRRNPTRPNAFRDDYLLSGVTPGQPIRVNMVAPGFDDYLQLINASTGAVVAFNDDANGTRNAELNFTTQAGTSYIVRATSFGANATGSYTLRSNTGTLFNSNQVLNGALSTTDLRNPTRSNTYRDDYLLTGVTPGQQIRINMTAPGFDDYLQLINATTGLVVAENDDANGTRNAELNFTAQAGASYIVRATSFGANATGSYSLSSNTGTLFNPNQVLNGALSTSDRRNPTRPDTYRDDYLLTNVRPGQPIRVNMTASGFDDYLQLINASTGAVIASNDDANGSLNAELNFTAQAGVSYLVRATSFAPNVTGSYSLSSNTGTFLSTNQVVNGVLSSSDPRNPSRANTFRDDYLLTGVTPGRRIRVNMDAAGFDDYLQLINAATGAVIAFNDDANRSRNAELNFTAQAGTSYLVRATSFAANATGNYSLRTRVF